MKHPEFALSVAAWLIRVKSCGCKKPVRGECTIALDVYHILVGYQLSFADFLCSSPTWKVK
jgi:hypothetical protein